MTNDWKRRAAELTEEELQADETYESIRAVAAEENWNAMQLGGVCRAMKKRAKALGDADLVSETVERSDELKAVIMADRARVAAQAKKNELIAKRSANALIRAQTEGTIANEDFFPAEIISKMPPTYAVGSDGVKLITDGEETIICGTPVVPIMKYTNEQDEKTYYKLKYLAYREGGLKPLEKTFPAGVLASKQKILALSDYDILVTSQNAGAMVEYFDTLFRTGKIPIGRSTTKLGWDEDWNFVPYDMDTHYSGSEQHVFEQLTSVAGKPEDYMAKMREIRKEKNLAVNVPIATAMAAPLVKYVGGIQTSIVHTYGDTGKGKSLGVMVALSQYGAAKKGGVIANYTGTISGQETRLDFLNNLPVVMDDTANKRDEFDKPKAFQRFVYTVCDGQGRSRARVDKNTGEVLSARTKTWETIILSTGEEKATTGFTQGGGLNRVFELRVGAVPMFADTDTIVNFFESHHGHVVRPFLAVIKGLGRTGVKAIYAEYMTKLRDKLGESGSLKQLQPIALILTADKILAEEIYCDKVYLWDQIDELIKSMKSNDDISDGLRGYEYLQDWITANPRSMQMNAFTNEIHGTQAGFVSDTGTAYFVQSELARILENGGYKIDTLLNWAEAKGLTSRDKNGHLNKVTYIRSGAPKKRMIELKMPNLEAEQLGADSLAREAADAAKAKAALIEEDKL